MFEVTGGLVYFIVLYFIFNYVIIHKNHFLGFHRFFCVLAHQLLMFSPDIS